MIIADKDISCIYFHDDDYISIYMTISIPGKAGSYWNLECNSKHLDTLKRVARKNKGYIYGGIFPDSTCIEYSIKQPTQKRHQTRLKL